MKAVVRLTLFNVADCQVVEALVFSGGAWRWIRQPILVALLEHPRRGQFLIDCGVQPRVRRGWGKWFWRLAGLDLHIPELAKVLPPLTGLLFTHLHLDHVGGVLDFPGLPLWLSRQSWQEVQAMNWLWQNRFGYLAHLFPEDLPQRAQWLEDLPLVEVLGPRLPNDAEVGPAAYGLGLNLASEHGRQWWGRDLFGDGSVVAVPLPGHAHGQFGYWLETEVGPVFLLADSVGHSALLQERCANRLPLLFANQRSIEAQTRRRLQALRRSCPELWMIPSHCPRAWRAYGSALLGGGAEDSNLE